MTKTKEIIIEKVNLHPRNKHRSRYDFKQLISVCSELAPLISINKYNNESIDFTNPIAVKTLNKALLKYFYGISNWDIPENYLCPPIPGRADYIHYIADLLSTCNNGVIPTGKSVKALDIGMGANCIYPIIGTKEYGWKFVGSDIDPVAIKSANEIIKNNKLSDVIECRQQNLKHIIFRGIIKPTETFDITMCNPPFHASLAEANAGTERKWKNLGNTKTKKRVLNFGGQNAELWCKGGEKEFVSRMVEESAEIPEKCFWFSTLISKQANLKGVYNALIRAQAFDIKTIDMAQGQKVSRIVAWTFLNRAQQTEWAQKRWNK
ncbi:MAG: 23S rRNA (adenine(1618)-N(6))-methyltransferase RlmF [Bacteroidota bacterium]